MGGWEAQRKCVRCMQGVCCGFCTNFHQVHSGRWYLLSAGDGSVLNLFAHARARTCPDFLRRFLAMHRRSAGRASEIVMQLTSGASVRREPVRPRRLVLLRLQNMRNQKNKLQHTVIVIANITMFFTGSEI